MSARTSEEDENTRLVWAVDIGLVVITAVLAYLWLGDLWPNSTTLLAATSSCQANSLNASLCGLNTYQWMRVSSYAITVLAVLAAAALTARILERKTLPGLLWVGLAILLLIYPAYTFIILRLKASDAPALVLQASIVICFFLLGLLKYDVAHPPTSE